MPSVAPYGTWSSPITAEATTRAGIRITDRLATDEGCLFWVESRPIESGRSALVRRTPDGVIADFGPPEFNTRTSAHEYGGGAYAASAGVAYASSFADQRLYRLSADGPAVPITPEPEPARGLRYADLTIRNRWAIGVRERHDTGGEPTNELVRIALDGSGVEVVASGHDFFSSPRISPDGTRLAWLAWDHPDMPWDATGLWVADLTAEGRVSTPHLVAGGESESIFQPEWGPDGVIHFVSDRTGWWNLYRGEEAEPLAPMTAEFGVPQWGFGMSRYCFLPDGRLVAAFGGPDGDALLVLGGRKPRTVALPFAGAGSSLAAAEGAVFLVASGPDRTTGVVRVGIDDTTVEEIHVPPGPRFDPGLLSIPERIAFDTPDGEAYALYYPPANPEFTAPGGERPPVIVTIHGGPTAAARPGLLPGRLFWTSRGFGVLDVDYGGSSGYGRAYRRRLEGTWGVVDVRDCALAAAHLAAAGRADPQRLVISGGSAGGFTVLLALAQHQTFAAGSAQYAVTDLETLATDTHKFESRYLDRLVGPYPEARQVYRERSPIEQVDSIRVPVLLLQGADDRVVPPEQARAMRDALVRQGVPVGYLEFAGEGHGFRAASTQVRALEAELWFYGRVLGFEPADDLEPLDIAGL